MAQDLQQGETGVSTTSNSDSSSSSGITGPGSTEQKGSEMD